MNSKRVKTIRAVVDGRGATIVTDGRIVATCRPVLWPWPDLPETPVYPGSVRGACTACGVEVWVGPKAQELGEQAERQCFECSTREAGAYYVGNLGNTYLPKEELA